MIALEVDLVTQGQHDDGVLCLHIAGLVNVGQAEIVTGIDYEVAELVGETHGD